MSIPLDHDAVHLVVGHGQVAEKQVMDDAYRLIEMPLLVVCR